LPAATLEPQVLVEVKSAAFAPDKVRTIEVRGALPKLVRVIAWAADATPSAVLPKAGALEERVRLGAGPVPDRLTASGGALPVSVAARAEV
jgi:hypothetical protein